ncbi:hypothetical protein L3Q82_013493 [Scortum barcoo]|uniref:Uncharacterized protein n=1 Tax=Scortum barcoo TaxID=214431 RepID=A0ACB8W297_9TELE|nr:hypothetical protein L3Q82_013493 [Scortum barcoo]
MANLVEVTTQQQFEDILARAGKCLTVVHFQAGWAPQCGQMNEVMAELAKQRPHATFVKLEAEAVPEVSEKYEIASVPTFLFFKAGEKVDRLDGAHAPELTKKVERLAVSGGPGEAAAESGSGGGGDLNQRLKRLINAAPCMLFMKGSAQEPRCGFSRQIVALLKEHDIQFSSFDILSDEEVRQGLKTYSNWPTYPQLYVNGELVGGLDIVKELAESGELENTCPKAVTLEHRLKTLINQSPVMLFMKGNKEAARCGFSRQTLELLNDTGVDYDTFDILQDEEVRQGLKSYSNWPTYPQLYVKGELIGGLDILKELKESGDLYLGKWYFKAATSRREADIQKFKVLDNLWFIMEETANNTLLLTGHMRIGDDCTTMTWTYHIRPERDDLELEGKTERKSLLWSGKWANCSECIIMQEVEPPLSPTDTEDSLNRHMLYDKRSEMMTSKKKNPPSRPHYRPMYRGKPCHPDMSLREKQQKNLDTDCGTHAGMGAQSRSSHKYLLLQVWCGLLTVAMVVMAALLISIKPKSTEVITSVTKGETDLRIDIQDKVSTEKPVIINPTVPNNYSWQVSSRCSNCDLILHNNSIYFKKESLYLIYAQVTFSRHHKNNLTKSVILKRNAMPGVSVRKLAGGTFPHRTEGTVWVANIVSLNPGDSISLDISDDYLKDNTFWGAYQLH